MSNSGTRHWYIADGDGRREYSDVFLRFGVMLIGPRDSGNYFDNREAYLEDNYVRRFAEEVNPGDIVILKHGVNSIIAAGTIDEREDSYGHFEVFGDVEGFTLQHGRYVTWHKPEKEMRTSTRLPRDRLCKCNNSDIQQIAKRIINGNEPVKSEEIPPPARKVDDEELIRHLIEHGLSSGQAEDVIRAFWRVRRLGRWYEDHLYEDQGEDISEHETRRFLITPLLLALGWPEQRLKIEWNRFDIAFFETSYSRDENPIMILESKRLGVPLGHALEQVKKYSENFPNCNKLVTSNGIRYLLFVKEKNEWTKRAYLNLLKLLARHPYYTEVEGAPELLTRLLP